MGKLIYAMMLSLDGFISGADTVIFYKGNAVNAAALQELIRAAISHNKGEKS
jgi:hypothetical protein